MQKRASIAFGGFLLALWAGLSAVLLAKGGLYLAKHEGDTIHLIDMVIRQSQGEWPHLDYMTPIGWLATAPIALFVGQGWGIGMAYLGAQVLFAAALLPAIWWVGISRLKSGWAMVLGVICIGLCLAMVHGESQPSLSISMHYNRWAWALAFIAIAIVFLPSAGRHSQTADGLVLGVTVAGMALIKVTYVAAFLPVILLALLMHRQWGALLVALVTGLAIVAAMTLVAGTGFWIAYLGDLLTVTGSEARAQPGHSLYGVIAAPAYLGGSFAALAAVMLLRQAGRDSEGVLLLLLVPGFFFVTFQNYGNDPQWLYLLGVLLFALRPAAGVTNGMGWDMRQALALAGCAVFMLGLPSALNLAFSPFRHLNAPASAHTQLFPRSVQHDDIHVLIERNRDPAGNVRLPVLFAAETGTEKDEPKPTMVMGEELPFCRLSGGTVTVLDGIARDLEAAGYAGAAIYSADLLSSYWLFGDLQRLEGAAPWRYDGLPGIEGARLLLVPLCPMDGRARRGVIEDLEARGVGLKEVHRNEVYRLYEFQPGEG
ncbi:hypothetical protein R3X27_06020 [Tropicimonas sp. TH_r6]|uniref:glycosyltransferase family 87 protein n=1 Tax=Tropicimonas sp. TH_r6 TaxID=3082085 RepID=UPI002954DD67|nr:hypothetical protein [Tropicimonas sp. TH_r6]MDV7142232.1 hypothetical protein [Tropicimonas sp. TH_r6]